MQFLLRIIIFSLLKFCYCNPDAKRLYDDLINGYNNMIRPVGNNSDRLVVKMGLRLSQLIDVNLKNQIMTTNVWVEQEWNDYKLKWEPEEYGGVNKLHVPSEQIWLPDLVLYNNADGNYEITIMTKAILHSDGLVIWKPPAIYKSSCEIDVEYFPFDEQTCFMKFGSWTYDGYTVNLKHIHGKDDNPVIEMGMDLSAFYLSVEWDIMAVPARRKVIFYSCCEEPFIDITFNITLRRKTLFYTFNLIIPCVAISFLSILVFYLPSDSGEKVSLSISIMLSLVVFFLLLAEIIPPTSLTVPLLGRYLLFTMILVTLSSVVTIAVLNINFRSPSTHLMAPWVRRIFIEMLPKYLYMKRPEIEDEDEENNKAYHDDIYSCNFENQLIDDNDNNDKDDFRKLSMISSNSNDFALPIKFIESKPFDSKNDNALRISSVENEEFNINSENENQERKLEEITPKVKRLTKRIQFLSQHKKNLDSYLQVEEDWKYVAMVLDRLFLWIFTVCCISGAGMIILRAPNLYNFKQPIDILYSKVGAEH